MWQKRFGKVVVITFLILVTVYLFQIGPDYPRGRLTAHLDRIVLPLMIAFFFLRTRHVDGPEERRFWRLIIAGLIAWLAGTSLYLVSALAELPRSIDLAVDGCYIMLYLFMFLAGDQQPQLPDGWSKRDVLYPFNLVSATVFIAIVFCYMVVVPWAVEQSENAQFFASFNLYVTLDCILTLRFLLLWRASEQLRWRRCFVLLAAATAALAVGDLLEGMSFAGYLEMVAGARADLVWLIPHLCLAGVALTCTRDEWTTQRADAGSSRRVQSLLPVYAFVLPLVHLGLYLLDYLDPAARPSREAIVFFGLVVFAVLSLVQQTRLEGTVTALRADLMIRAMDDTMRQSQRMESIGRLAGGVAHDLNNLLMVIKSYAGLAGQRVAVDDAETRDKLGEIDRAADRAADLIRQLLAFGKQQVLRPEVVAVNDKIRGLEDMLGRILSEGIELVVELDPAAGCVKVDPGLLEQVVVNLAVNARDAMPRGGRLVIRTTSVDGDDGSGDGDGDHRGWVEIAVSDTGVGIEPAIQERIFEPYFTTKEMEKGTGLGLATVHGIVEQSGGVIDVDSEPGVGSTFRVLLPRTSDAQVVETPTRGRRLCEVAGQTVLLTEDETTIREALAEYLSDLGLEVLQAVDGVDALEVAERHEGPIDVLVTDLVMPRMNGPDLARRLARLRPEVKVVYVSGFTPETMLEYGVSSDEAVFLQKPFVLEELASTIREVLET
jgi:signal transduction histidine kinase